MGITVAVTGPTGEIGRSAVAALEAEPEVERIVGMARRPIDPAAVGWAKTEYLRGDVVDRAAVARLVADADVVVHLAFTIMGSREQAARVNLDGSRTVFAAAADAPRVRRLVYTSSVAAYGYHRDNPQPITEDVAPRGSDEHYYSAQKARVEALLAEVTAESGMDVYVLRPCIVAGPSATALADYMPWNRVREGLSGLSGRLPGVRRLPTVLRLPGPLIPDPGVRLQLVHPDDVAGAIVAAALGRGPAGAYNLAGDGDVSFSEVLAAVGAHGVRVPHALAVAASQSLRRIPLLPAMLEWVHAGQASSLMDTGKAKRQLGWQPAYTSEQALAAMAAALDRP